MSFPDLEWFCFVLFVVFFPYGQLRVRTRLLLGPHSAIFSQWGTCFKEAGCLRGEGWGRKGPHSETMSDASPNCKEWMASRRTVQQHKHSHNALLRRTLTGGFPSLLPLSGSSQVSWGQQQQASPLGPQGSPMPEGPFRCSGAGLRAPESTLAQA